MSRRQIGPAIMTGTARRRFISRRKSRFIALFANSSSMWFSAWRSSPAGQITHLIDFPVQPLLQKHFPSSPKQISPLVAPSRPTEGRIAIVTNAGRDAVDVVGAFDEWC